MLKRDNWTNQELIAIIKGQTICQGDGSPSIDPYFMAYNDGLLALVQHINSFVIPEKEFGALAFDTEDGVTYHIGEIPEEMKPKENKI